MARARDSGSVWLALSCTRTALGPGQSPFQCASCHALRCCTLAPHLLSCRAGTVLQANVLEVSQLWREVVIEMHKDYKDVELSHMCGGRAPRSSPLP